MKHKKLLHAGGLCVAAAALTLAVSVSATAAMPSYPAVTQSRLDHAQSDNGWLMYRRNYKSWGYAPFKQIDAGNVDGLKLAWDYKSPLKAGFEAAPIVNGDYMFVTTPKDHLLAFNATTGKLLWKYVHEMPKKTFKTVCCDVVNRGVALYGNNVYMGTLDNYVVALDAKTGKVVWKNQLKPAGIGYAITGAPLIVNGKVIIGVAGGEFGIRGFLEALDAKTGKVAWKTYTIPGPGQPGHDTWADDSWKHGGAPTWNTGTYDPETNTLYWGVGNTGPWLWSKHKGKNLYADSVLAIDPATGKIKWYYQYTANDTWDYDGVNAPVVVDINYKGKPYKAIVTANRNGWFYAIDRTNGKLIYARPFITATGVSRVVDGQTITNDALRPQIGKPPVFVCPSAGAATNWWPIAVDPETHMAYLTAFHTCELTKGVKGEYKQGSWYLNVTADIVQDPAFPGRWGDVLALNLDNNAYQVWNHPSHLPWSDGELATAGGVVFSGSRSGHLYAFDAKTGKVLWKSPQMSSGIIGVPTTYKVDGRQYVAVWAGWGGVIPVIAGGFSKSLAKVAKANPVPRGGHLYVFALPKK